MRDINGFTALLSEAEFIEEAKITTMNLGNGSAVINASMDNSLFYKVLAERTELSIDSEQGLMNTLVELSSIKKKYDRLKGALDEVEATGYGIVMPTLDELTLDEPEIMKQGGKYGVRLSASAPSIHMIKANITTEVAPLVGSESQSEELVNYLLKEFEESPEKIWESDIFGKSLHELVNEGLRSKLYHMPTDARLKLQGNKNYIIKCNLSCLPACITKAIGEIRKKGLMMYVEKIHARKLSIKSSEYSFSFFIDNIRRCFNWYAFFRQNFFKTHD